MDETELSAHEVGVADLLVEALVVELDDPVDSVAQHGLQRNTHTLGSHEYIQMKNHLLEDKTPKISFLIGPAARVCRSLGPCLA